MNIKSIISNRLDKLKYLRGGEINIFTYLSYALLPNSIRPIEITKKILALRAKQIGIYPDDTFLISYPHSGRTWLSCLLSNLKKPDSDWKTKDCVIPNYATDELMENAMDIDRPRIFAIHNVGPFEPYYAKGIYILRDGRDVAVSLFKTLKRNGFKYDFDQFVKMYVVDGFNGSPAWHNHITEYLIKKQSKPILPIKYEDLCEDPERELLKICNFINLETTRPQIAHAIEICSFKNYQKNTNNLGVKGGAGAWKSNFNDELHAYYWNIAGETLSELGYPK